MVYLNHLFLLLWKKNILQTMEIKAPLEIDYEKETIDQIVEKIEYAIEQHPYYESNPSGRIVRKRSFEYETEMVN